MKKSNPFRLQVRGENACFTRHDSELGNASAYKLFDLVTVNRSGDGGAPPRSFGDYEVTIDKENVPPGVTVNEMI